MPNNQFDFAVPKFARSARYAGQFAATATTFTPITAKGTDYQIFIRRIIVWIKTDAAQSLTFQDNAGTPLVICKIPASPGADTRWDFDFGPTGVPLTVGKNLTATFSAAGLAGHMVIQGYQTNNQSHL